jgi:hypothetical protein
VIETPIRSKYIFPNTTEVYEGHLSPSQVTEYLNCGLCFYLNRVRKMPKPLSINLPIGSAIHKAVEQARLDAANFHRLGTQPVPVDEVAASWFDQEISQPADPESGTEIMEIDLGSKFDSLGKAKDLVVSLAQYVVPQILKLDSERGKLAATEFNLLQLSSPWPFKVEGRMDALYVDWLADATKPELATLSSDLKTSSKQEPPDEFIAIAQSIYRQFWVSRDLPMVILADVAAKTVRPSLQTYTLNADDYGQQLAYQTVMDVAEDISAGRFRPRPNWRCSYLHGFNEFQATARGFGE